jgi:hypothetical protein
MGSLRRQLSILIITITPAWAEVCDKDRPAWSAADGPVSQWGEALHFLTTLPPLLLIAALIAGWVFRQPILFNIVTIIALVLLFPLLFPLNQQGLASAMAEGCKGPTTIVIGMLAAICCTALAG